VIRVAEEITLRLIANRALSQGQENFKTYVAIDASERPLLRLRPPIKRFHVYVSPYNEGGPEVLEELTAMSGAQLITVGAKRCAQTHHTPLLCPTASEITHLRLLPCDSERVRPLFSVDGRCRFRPTSRLNSGEASEQKRAKQMRIVGKVEDAMSSVVEYAVDFVAVAADQAVESMASVANEMESTMTAAAEQVGGAVTSATEHGMDTVTSVAEHMDGAVDVLDVAITEQVVASANTIQHCRRQLSGNTSLAAHENMGSERRSRFANVRISLASVGRRHRKKLFFKMAHARDGFKTMLPKRKQINMQALHMTTSKHDLQDCDHSLHTRSPTKLSICPAADRPLFDLRALRSVLVYLTNETWTRGDASNTFADEVRGAMKAKMHLILVHEMPGIGGATRGACEFSTFFSCEHGTTPSDLIKSGIYHTIALPLKGGSWREMSLAMLNDAFAAGLEKTQDAFALKGDRTQQSQVSNALQAMGAAGSAAMQALQGGGSFSVGDTLGSFSAHSATSVKQAVKHTTAAVVSVDASKKLAAASTVRAQKVASVALFSPCARVLNYVRTKSCSFGRSQGSSSHPTPVPLPDQAVRLTPDL
jgi:hypothetical protein